MNYVLPILLLLLHVLFICIILCEAKLPREKQTFRIAVFYDKTYRNTEDIVTFSKYKANQTQ